MKKIFLILTLIPLILMASPNVVSQQKLDQIMAPIALYPDALLSEILMASTYPDEVQEAVQWSRVNSNLQAEEALQAARFNNWDPSVTSLVAFPQVLDMMGKYPDWVEDMGDAFLTEPDAVMDSVQRLRIQAQRNGYLITSQKQTIITQDNQGTRTIIIQPTYSNTIYVPVYDPMQVYGSWFYPEYEPFFYYPPYFYMAPGVYFGFSLGIVIGDVMWSGFDWYHHDVYINVPRYNAFYPHRKINQNQRNISWKNEWRLNNSHIVNYKTSQKQRINFKTNEYKPVERNMKTNEYRPAERGIKTNDYRPTQKNVQTNDTKPVERNMKTNEYKPVERGIKTNDNKPTQKNVQTNDTKPVERNMKTNEYKPVERGIKTNDNKPTQKNVQTNDTKPVERNIKTNDHKSDDNNAQNNERQSNDGGMNNNNDRNNFQHGQRNY